MKALSVRQPWTWAILHAGKDVENRSWYTSFRGPLAIHAGKGFDFTKADCREVLAGDYGGVMLDMLTEFQANPANDVRGAIVGVVEVYGCVANAKCNSPWKAENPDGFCWLIRNPKVLASPVPMLGALGLFAMPEDIRAAVEAQL